MANANDKYTPMLTLIHAAEHIQATTSSFTNLTAENKGRQEAAALLYRQSREVAPPRIAPACPTCNSNHNPDNPCRAKVSLVQTANTEARSYGKQEGIRIAQVWQGPQNQRTVARLLETGSAVVLDVAQLEVYLELAHRQGCITGLRLAHETVNAEVV